jgi:hypothetical protein
MKASELRIGNWIAHEPTIDDWEEIIVRPGTIIQCEISPDSFMPIPLTEEWLLKFGFEWKNFALRNGKFTVRFQKYFYVYLSFEGVSPIQINLEYVHQLQNLYFALTGEELVVKE